MDSQDKGKFMILFNEFGITVKIIYLQSFLLFSLLNHREWSLKKQMSDILQICLNTLILNTHSISIQDVLTHPS